MFKNAGVSDGYAPARSAASEATELGLPFLYDLRPGDCAGRAAIASRGSAGRGRLRVSRVPAPCRRRDCGTGAVRQPGPRGSAR